MKKYLLISLLVLSFGLYSCSDDSTSPSSDDTMPLKVGNSWTYDGTYSHYNDEIEPITVKITDYGTYEVKNYLDLTETVTGYLFLTADDSYFTLDKMIVVDNTKSYDFYMNYGEIGDYYTYSMTVVKDFEGVITDRLNIEYTFEKGTGIVKIEDASGYTVELTKKSLK